MSDGQQLVDFVVQQIALLLAHGDELPDLVVFLFDRQRDSSCLPAVLPCAGASAQFTRDVPASPPGHSRVPASRLRRAGFLHLPRQQLVDLGSMADGPVFEGVDLARSIQRSRSRRLRFSAFTHSAAGAGFGYRAAIPVMSAASSSFRRSSSAAGKLPRVFACQRARRAQDVAAGQPGQIVLLELGQHAVTTSPDPTRAGQQVPFRVVNLPAGPARSPRRERRLPRHRRLADLLPDDVFRHAGAMRRSGPQIGRGPAASGMLRRDGRAWR